MRLNSRLGNQTCLMSQSGKGRENRQKKPIYCMTMNCRKLICYTEPSLCLLPAQWVYHPHGSPCQRQAIRNPFTHSFPYYLLPDLTPQHSTTSVHTAACALHLSAVCPHPRLHALYRLFVTTPGPSVHTNEPLCSVGMSQRFLYEGTHP